MGFEPHSAGSDPRRRSGGATWVKRCLLAIVAPLGFLCALEATLRLVGYGEPTGLFIPDERPGFYRTNPNFTLPFFPRQFDITPLNFRIARHKETGHLRIFVLGESAVRGTPEPGFGFTAQLEAQLAAAYPDKQVEVYNLGIVAINSHVVYQAARAAAGLEPDLFVVYMGNNEVVGPYGPGSANLSVMPPLAVIRASIWVGETRTGQLIRRLAARLPHSGGKPLVWHGMSTFEGKTVRGDDPRLAAVYRNYEANLRDIVRVASHAGARTILATVVANLRDSPPFASLHRPAITRSELDRWNLSFDRGLDSWELDRSDDAIQAMRDALEIDPQYADAHFILGSLLCAKGDMNEGRRQLLEALHWDALRFRPDLPINAIARKVASESGGSVVLLDSALELGSDPASSAPPCGEEILLEHVHFNWDGNVLMGRMMAEKSAHVLFGPSRPPAPWLDGGGCARAVGFTAFGALRMLVQMEPIRGKPPFTSQLRFGETQVRYEAEKGVAAAKADSPAALSEARSQLEAATARSPGNPNLYLRLSEVQTASNDPIGALRSIDLANQLLPLSPELLVERARALEALQRFPEAQASILEAIRLDPYNLPSYTALVEVVRRTGDFELGRKVLLDALAKIPDGGYLRVTYADLLFFHGDRDEAVGECKSALARDPADPDALRRLVSLYTAEGRKDEAFELMARARFAQPLNFENNLALARIYQGRGNEDEAAECLRSMEAGGPANSQVHIFLARRDLKSGRPTDALVELARARRVALINGDESLASKISGMMQSIAR